MLPVHKSLREKFIDQSRRWDFNINCNIVTVLNAVLLLGDIITDWLCSSGIPSQVPWMACPSSHGLQDRVPLVSSSRPSDASRVRTALAFSPYAVPSDIDDYYCLHQQYQYTSPYCNYHCLNWAAKGDNATNVSSFQATRSSLNYYSQILCSPIKLNEEDGATLELLFLTLFHTVYS